MKMTKLNETDRMWARGMLAEWNSGGGREPHRWPGPWFRAKWVQLGITEKELENVRWMVKQAMIGR